jgi:hypothetical protein
MYFQAEELSGPHDLGDADAYCHPPLLRGCCIPGLAPLTGRCGARTPWSWQQLWMDPWKRAFALESGHSRRLDNYRETEQVGAGGSRGRNFQRNCRPDLVSALMVAARGSDGRPNQRALETGARPWEGARWICGALFRSSRRRM